VTAVQAEGLTRTYGTAVAVDGLTFSLGEGRILGMLGPNGAGKTTAIRMLTTILAPSSGTFAVAGIPGRRTREIRGRIGVLPESAGYPARESGAEYLAYHARLHGQTEAAARIAARRLLAEVGLGERGNSLIHTYSRGMRQRLGIARALVNDPAVVFLDEPTLGLDPQGQRDVLEMVGRMASQRGVTVVVSTHLLDEVEQVCTDVLILNRARVAAHGPVGEVVRRAAAPRSARLRTDPERCEEAARLLTGIDAVAAARASPPGGHPGEVSIEFSAALDGPAAAAAALAALLDAGLPVAAFSLEGGRLSDAFMEVVSA
jgi:ABC-2 type transport system ATP-binding protein